MSSPSVPLSRSGPPDTVVPPPDPESARALEAALATPAAERRAAIAEVVRRWPRVLDGWAALGAVARDEMEGYAAFRVGYHRGLDLLRQSGWRGSGYVRWSHPTNRGFLRCLEGLRASAERIGEHDEAERCALFLRQLDPTWPPSDLADRVAGGH